MNVRAIFTLCIVSQLLLGSFAFAEVEDKPDPTNKGRRVLTGLEKTGDEANYKTYAQANLSQVIGGIIQGIFSLLGIIFLALVVYGGFQWMTAAGEEKQVGQALSIIQNAAIGLFVCLAGYAITVFIVNALKVATGMPG